MDATALDPATAALLLGCAAIAGVTGPRDDRPAVAAGVAIPDFASAGCAHEFALERGPGRIVSLASTR